MKIIEKKNQLRSENLFLKPITFEEHKILKY